MPNPFMRRLFAAAIALGCWIGLAIVVGDFAARSGSALHALARSSIYFTNWTALFGAMLFSGIAADAEAFDRPWLIANMAVSAAIVTILYWGFYGLSDFRNAARSAQFLHGAMPVLVAGFWLLCTRHGALRLRQIWRWTAFPLAYIVYFLAVGYATGVYPYGAADVSLHGVRRVAMLVAATVGLIACLGVLIVVLDRRLARRSA